MAATRTRVLGTTRLLEPIGQGGMAEVYRGVQEPLSRPVAVKVMLPNIAKRKEMAQRFRREALALAALAHENIVAIHDLVEKNNQIFLITEFVDGVDVLSLLKARGPLPLDISLLIGVGVARALEHAHFRRIVHRDVKPGNVMLSRTGQVKLMDFGVAKDLGTHDLTKTGAVVGTPSYLAPELLRGARPDPSADVYALGVLLYNCISGKQAFKPDKPAELFANIAAGRRETLREAAPGVPRGIEKLVEQCLAVDPADRPESAALVRWRLETHASRLVKTPPAQRLVAFLHECHEVDDDALTLLAMEKGTRYETSPSNVQSVSSYDIEISEGDVVDETGEPGRAPRWWLRVALILVLGLAAGGVAARLALGPDWHQTLWQAVRDAGLS